MRLLFLFLVATIQSISREYHHLTAKIYPRASEKFNKMNSDLRLIEDKPEFKEIHSIIEEIKQKIETFRIEILNFKTDQIENIELIEFSVSICENYFLQTWQTLFKIKDYFSIFNTFESLETIANKFAEVEAGETVKLNLEAIKSNFENAQKKGIELKENLEEYDNLKLELENCNDQLKNTKQDLNELKSLHLIASSMGEKDKIAEQLPKEIENTALEAEKLKESENKLETEMKIRMEASLPMLAYATKSLEEILANILEIKAKVVEKAILPDFRDKIPSIDNFKEIQAKYFNSAKEGVRLNSNNLDKIQAFLNNRTEENKNAMIKAFKEVIEREKITENLGENAEKARYAYATALKKSYKYLESHQHVLFPFFYDLKYDFVSLIVSEMCLVTSSFFTRKMLYLVFSHQYKYYTYTIRKILFEIEILRLNNKIKEIPGIPEDLKEDQLKLIQEYFVKQEERNEQQEALYVVEKYYNDSVVRETRLICFLFVLVVLVVFFFVWKKNKKEKEEEKRRRALSDISI